MLYPFSSLHCKWDENSGWQSHHGLKAILSGNALHQTNPSVTFTFSLTQVLRTWEELSQVLCKIIHERPLLFLPCSMQAHELGLVVFLLAFFSSSFSSEEPGKLFFQCTEGSRSSKLKLLPKTETPTHSSCDRVPTAWEPSAQFITATAPLLRTSFLYRLFFLVLQQND